ncbi:MAG: MBL fold metallo-hydrolase [Propionibacteriaceae bacterium]|jgi:L-ascorbate metabolism protein UlaG (beta-lactamase superfamily)|nr:MBL fold metallo-hydrolase [Propionibacteriaceae bacterium]
MKISHLGHATVLLETDQFRLLIDPGNYSDAWHELTDIDAVAITHAHPDHVDLEHLPRLVAHNPQMMIICEPGVLDLDLPGRPVGLPVGSSLELPGVKIEAVGGRHALIHADIPQIGNVGYVVQQAAGPVFFHPGDELDAIPVGIDILAVPAHGPWCAMKETIDFVRAIGAGDGFLIHEGLINQRGWDLTFARLQQMTDTKMIDLRGGVLKR